MANIESVSIKFKPGTYNIFRNLQNKYWYAFGEYVDNAVQSYENNKVLFKELYKGKYQFSVHINFDWENQSITISDNAGGIDEKNFQRAFEPANIPIDATGLHEFGMGMKTASIWLSDIWTVRSAAINELEERILEFDLSKVLKDDKEILSVISKPKLKSEHYTEITLKGFTKNVPSTFQMSKLRSHLASIYRKFIRTGEMQLFINEDLLTYKDPEILNAPPVNNPDLGSLLWKKNIDFTLGPYKAVGFIALLNELSTTEHNGLSLFRRGRVIEGSHDEKYRPKVLFSQIGSHRYKRLFGELELSGFEVSFNKGSFQDSGDIEALMEALKIELTHKDFNLLKQGDEFRILKTKDDTVKVAKSLIDSLNIEKTQSPLEAKIETYVKEIENADVTTNNSKLLLRAKPLESYEETFSLKDEKYKLKLELINEPSISNLYDLIVEESSTFNKIAIYKINLSHPFFTHFDQFKKEEDYKPIILIIRSLVIAEIHASTQGTKNAGNVRTNFNSFLRNI